VTVYLFRYDRHRLIGSLFAAAGSAHNIYTQSPDDLFSTIQNAGTAIRGQDLGSDIRTEARNGQKILIRCGTGAELRDEMVNV